MFSCVKFSEEFSTDYRIPFSNYKVNDVIYFKSDLNDIDTLIITKIDSVSYKDSGPNMQPNKTIFLEAMYSSKDNFNAVNHTFISAHKQQINNNPKNDEYFFYIQFRDFSGYLDVTKINDTIKTERGLNRDTLKSDSIIEIYWSKNKGMLGYKKKNGELFKKT